MSKPAIQTTISPYTQEPILTRPLASETELDTAIAEAVKAQKSWKKVPLEERIAIAEKWLVSSFVSCFVR
jgi:acyl-CoA reductase-like NAD-dependent aldehyde dehydrogenase